MFTIKGLQYKAHLLLTLKNKTLIISLLQILFILLLTNLTDYTYCMTNESDNGSEISSIFEYEDTYMQDMVTQGYEHIKTGAYHHFVSETTDPVANAFGPMFEYYKGTHPRLDAESLNSTPLVEKIKMLEQDYFTTSVEKEILDKALEDQGAQLVRRHESLLKAKGSIKSLTQENLELKNQIDELQRLLRESLRK